ncbi:MAG: pyridoxal phosphate-dependent aminotransferase [Lachnospiraceae bacterium]|nr:pyridoxal phosphate-dependent aminotransferase [Lachnospiraceae bacterium]
MSEYNFDEIINRTGTNSLKWDVRDGELPMWVADMDFPTAPCIREAIEKRAAHGVFGYSDVPDEWYDAYFKWWLKYHNLKMEKNRLIFTTGVIPALSTAVRKFTTPAEKIVIQTPVYNIFFNSIINNGRRVLENRLKFEDGAYSMDFEDLEKKLSDPLTTMLILCNPHNPIGKIWDESTLKRVGELCAKHHVLVFSDEIHCDIVEPGREYIPFASVSEECRMNSITAVAPTKCFNIAGLNTAAVYVPEEGLYNRMNRALNTDEVAEPNAFAMDATLAAFSDEGHEWLEALNAYIEENKKTVYEFIENELQKVKAVRQDATYLMWLDMSSYTEDSKKLQAAIRSKTGLYLSPGSIFGKGGERFLRMNVACPRSLVIDGLNRLKTALNMG